MPAYDKPALPELFKRAQVALDSANVSLQDLSDRFGGSKNAWFQRLRSKHLPTYLDNIAEACGIEVEWIRRGKQAERRAPSVIPLVGRVAAGDGHVDQWRPADNASISIPGHWAAVKVEGKSAYPVVFNGQIAWIDPERAFRPSESTNYNLADAHERCTVRALLPLL